MTPLYSNWVVIGPLRSGSWGVARSISSYKPYRIFFQTTPNVRPRTLINHELVHTHDINWLQFVTDNTGVVICVRDPIQCAFSKCILPKFGHRDNQPIWHFAPGDEQAVAELEKNIEPFYLDPDVFSLEVAKADGFYRKIMEWPQWTKHTIINYNSWAADPSLILPQLGLEDYTPAWPLKNPGTPQQWIKNFDEIINHSKTLSLENYNQICQRD